MKYDKLYFSKRLYYSSEVQREDKKKLHRIRIIFCTSQMKKNSYFNKSEKETLKQTQNCDEFNINYSIKWIASSKEEWMVSKIYQLNIYRYTSPKIKN